MELDLSQSDSYGGNTLAMPDKPEPSYPCLYLTCEGVEDMPDSGMMRVRYRVKGRSERTDKNGDETHSVDLELLSINCPKKQPDVVGSSDDEEAMKDL